MAENIDIKINVVNTKSINTSKKQIEDLGRAGSRAGKNIENSFDQSGKSVVSFGDILIGAGIVGAFRGIISAVGNFGSTVVNEAKKIETFTTQFSTLTGSVELAEQQIRQLQEFAASTPFQFEGIAESAKVLLAFGFQVDETQELLRQLGDVSAVSGKPLKELAVIFGQVEATGKLTAERLNQLVESGVNIGPAIAQILNISEESVRAAVTAGQVSSEVFQQAFASLSEEGGLAFNGMISLSQTLGGVLSTLGDNFSLIAQDIGAELLPTIKSIAITVIELAQSFRNFFVNNIEEIKLFTGAIAGLSAGLTVLAARLLLVKLNVTATAFSFNGLRLAAISAWTAVGAPIIAITAGLVALGLGVTALITNYKGFAEVAKEASASVLDFVSSSLEFLSIFESGFRTMVGILAQSFNGFVDGFIAGLQLLAQATDAVLGTNIAGSIQAFRDTISDSIQAFKDGDGTLKELSTTTKIYAEDLRESAAAQREARLAEEARTEKLSELREEQTRLQEVIAAGDAIQSEAAKKRLTEIQAEINALNNVTATNQRKVQAEITASEQIAAIKQKFNEDQDRLEKEANGLSLTNLNGLLLARKESELKALRDKAVQDADFQTASLAQQELNEIEKTNRALEAERGRIDEINKLRLEQDVIDEEKKQVQAELEVVANEQDKEDLRFKLEELEIIRLENEAKQLQARGQHLAAIQKQREIEDKKISQRIQVRSDDEIRRERAKQEILNRVRQTSVQQAIGIGDNLVKAGIIQGETAAKALQGIKIGEAIINTFSAANLALATLPPPASFVTAAASIASGLANVAQIRSQKFQLGGIVQPINGVPRSGDRVPILANPGEEVLTRSNPRHRDNVANSDSSGSNRELIEAINGLGDRIEAMETRVELDGREIARSLSEERSRGVR